MRGTLRCGLRRRTPSGHAHRQARLGVLSKWFGWFPFPLTSAGFSAVTSSAGAWATDTLDAPTDVTALGGAQTQLTWTATPDTYAEGHRILRATGAGGPYVQIAEITPRALNSYVDTPGFGTYLYVIRALHLSWESGNSNVASAAVLAEDFDAVIAAADNCPATFNVDQFDTDGDGMGDACDPSPTAASTGTLANSGQALGSGRTWDSAVGDLDGHGAYDAIIASDFGANTVWLNNGSASFTNPGQSLGTGTTYNVALADVDGDGDLDAVSSNYAQANRIWINS